MFLTKKEPQENIDVFYFIQKNIDVLHANAVRERHRKTLAFFKSLYPFDIPPTPHHAHSMDPSRRIARDLRACLVVGPILLLMWMLRGCA